MREDELRNQIEDDYAAFFTGGFGGALIDALEKEKELEELEEASGTDEE